MTVSLNEILSLVGRLDDAAGFDTPRERFRRFLLAKVTDISLARILIEESLGSLDEQHHRALQDSIVLLGRFLGFEPSFGTYQRVAGAAKYDGQWRSRRRMTSVLEIRTDQTQGNDLTELARSLSAAAVPSEVDPGVRHLGLSVLTPLYGGRGRIDPTAAAGNPEIRLVSVRSLLFLADAVAAGRMDHEEILQLFLSGLELDFFVELTERFTAADQAGPDSNVRLAHPLRPTAARG